MTDRPDGVIQVRVARGARDAAVSRILGRMDDARLLETTIASRVVHTGRYLTVRVDTIRDADGGEHTPRHRSIIPARWPSWRSMDGSVLMVHQYRTPAGRVMLEIPAGTLERAPDGSLEDPRTAGSARTGRGDGLHRGYLAAARPVLHCAGVRHGVHAPVPGDGPLAHRGLCRAGYGRAPAPGAAAMARGGRGRCEATSRTPRPRGTAVARPPGGHGEVVP